MDAQTDVVSAGFNAGSVTENGISAVLGQPFDAIVEGGGYEVSEGVTQAQLVTEDITAEVDYGEAYTEDIRTSELWRSPNSNTNSTGFTSLPAGLYSAAHSRFEQMLVNTGYWSLSNGTSVPVTATEFPYYCDRLVESPVSASDMLSVRCVKNDE